MYSPAGSTRILRAFAAALVLLSCAGVTEYDLNWQSSLRVYSPSDLSLIASYPEMTSPRSMMITPGMVFVASTEGVVYAFDSQTRELLGEHVVGAPSASGYSAMVHSPSEGTAYLAGTTGMILELSLPDCQVIDEFSVCSSPFDLAVSNGFHGYLWIADASSNTIFQVKLSDNSLAGQKAFLETEIIQCIEPIWSSDSIMVGTSSLVYRVWNSGSGGLVRTFLTDAMGSFSTLDAIVNTLQLTAVMDSRLGVLYPFAYDTIPPEPSFKKFVQIEGSLHRAGDAGDGQHAFALTYLGNLTCRLWKYFYVGSGEILFSSDIPGYPLDMQVSGGGDIYVLSY